MAKRGEIIPAPLTWAESRTGPAAESDLEAGPLRAVVGGEDRPGEVVGVRRQRAGRAAHALEQGSRGSSLPITPVEATPTCAGLDPQELDPPARWVARAVSSPRSPSPTLEQPELATTARRFPVSASREAITGAPTRALVVKRAADTAPGGCAEEHAHVQPFGLDPGGGAGGGEAGGQRRGIQLANVRRGVDPA